MNQRFKSYITAPHHRLDMAGRVLAMLMIVAAGSGLAVAQTGTTAPTSETPIIAGWVENGWIGTPPIKVKVKLDTGAKNSSINAPDYREFRKNGQRYVAFDLVNARGRTLNVETPIVRTVIIRRAGIGKRRRPVIKLKVCVGGVTSMVQFTMADRRGMSYPILIGRTFLTDKVLVNSSKTFLRSNLCLKR